MIGDTDLTITLKYKPLAGQLEVQIEPGVDNKVLLYGVLEIAKDQIRSMKVEGSKIQVAQNFVPHNGNGGKG